jgi:hypothetical protein
MSFNLRKSLTAQEKCACKQPLYKVYIPVKNPETGVVQLRRVKVRICLACEKFVKEE